MPKKGGLGLFVKRRAWKESGEEVFFLGGGLRPQCTLWDLAFYGGT